MTAVARRGLGSTYRLQLNGLGFGGATALVPFLHELGIETCYVSPVTQARSGSTHGYDVIDPTRLDPALGTPADFEQLLDALGERDMGLLLDIVPNHMAASTESPFFADVLRLGPESPYASWFDIAWDEQDGRILLPVLGDALSEVVRRGELRVGPAPDSGLAALAYFDAYFPLAPETLQSAAESPLVDLLARQHYRLADWRVANQQVNYRRFFDINELIGVRQEDTSVFAATHSLILRLLDDDRVRGVRVDHIDGLRDPDGYLEMLQAAMGGNAPARVVVVEKILAGAEQLPPWPVDGTTGYEFGTALVGLFVDPVGALEIAAATAAATGDSQSFADRALAAKRRALGTLFPRQLERVATVLAQAISASGGSVPEVADVVAAVTELTAQLAVYRTYRRADVEIRPADAEYLQRATGAARGELADSAIAALDSVVEVLVGPLPTGSAAAGASSWEVAAGWQQLSGPATAKGVEDTAMYNSGQLLAVADVGSAPDVPALSAADFHVAMTQRASQHPAALSATSTHDSKRSHDVRCRLAVLSEISTEWNQTVVELDDLLVAGGDLGDDGPDAADRRYLYETLVGVWPVDQRPDSSFSARVRDCLVKSAREAKRHSSWIDPNERYERAYTDLADRAATGRAGERLSEVVAAIECAGATNSLASVLLKSTAPGVPDTYQGDDDWFLALVDPDNRRPVDAGHHQTLLHGPADHLIERWREGPIKQRVLQRSLQVRRDRADLFASGGYEALEVTGAGADHVVAFARYDGLTWVLTVTPRLSYQLAGPGRFPCGEVWTDTMLVLPAECPTRLVDSLTGRPSEAVKGRLAVGRILSELPVAMLVA